MALNNNLQNNKEELLKLDRTIHIDETPWPINNSHQKDGYMFVISHQGGSFYYFSESRSACSIKKLLGSYKGPILTDGYVSYKTHFKDEKGIDLAFCWSQ